MELTISNGQTYIVEFCNVFRDPIRMLNKSTLEPINYKGTSKNIQKLITTQFIKYLNDLTYPLDMNLDVGLYTQSPFLKNQLTLEQTNIIIECLEKENKHLDTSPEDIPAIYRTTVIAEPLQTGKSFIPLELSSHNITREGVTQSTLLVVPRTNISSWKSKLPHIYNEKYIIIDNVEILNSLLIPLIYPFEDTEELKNTRQMYRLTTDYKFDKSVIITNKLIIISSHIFDIFQYYSKLSKIVFARLFYDSIYNINDVHSLFDDTYIYVYLMTNNRTILPIYGHTNAYANINNKYIMKDHGILSMYLRCTNSFFIETDIKYKIINLKNEIEQYIVKIREIKGRLGEQKYIENNQTISLLKKIKINEDLITKFEEKLLDAKNAIKTSILFNKTQTQIQYIDTIKYKVLFNNISNNPVKSFIIRCLINNDYNTLIEYVKLYKLKTSQLYIDIGLDNTNQDSIINRIEESTDCPICFESIKCPLVTKCCYNVFCLNCFIKCDLEKPNSCPCCRKVINIESHCIIEDKIPLEKNKQLTIDIIKEHSQDLNIIDKFKMIIKYIVSKSYNPKIMIIVSNFSEYNLIINSILISEELTSFYYKIHNSSRNYSEEATMKSLDDFNKTILLDCIIMDEESYIHFIEMGYTLKSLDYIINYDSDLIFEAHSLPKIIKRSKIKDHVTTCIDLKSI